MANSDPCAVINSLAGSFASAVAAINRKFNSLRRLAQILEQAGDAAGALPSLNGLVPLSSIDLSTYNAMVAACPFLNLPPINGAVGLAALQSLVASAYAALIQSLTSGPYNRLAVLQAQMNKIQDKFNSVLSIENQILECLLAGCGSTAYADTQDQLDEYNQNYVAANGQILTPAQQAKLSAVQTMISTLNQLTGSAAAAIIPPATFVVEIPIPSIPAIPAPPPSGLID